MDTDAAFYKGGQIYRNIPWKFFFYFQRNVSAFAENIDYLCYNKCFTENVVSYKVV